MNGGSLHIMPSRSIANYRKHHFSNIHSEISLCEIFYVKILCGYQRIVVSLFVMATHRICIYWALISILIPYPLRFFKSWKLYV